MFYRIIFSFHKLLPPTLKKMKKRRESKKCKFTRKWKNFFPAAHSHTHAQTKTTVNRNRNRKNVPKNELNCFGWFFLSWRKSSLVPSIPNAFELDLGFFSLPRSVARLHRLSSSFQLLAQKEYWFEWFDGVGSVRAPNKRSPVVFIYIFNGPYHTTYRRSYYFSLFVHCPMCVCVWHKSFVCRISWLGRLLLFFCFGVHLRTIAPPDMHIHV